MATFAKILLYYSTLLSVVILVVGIVTSRSNSGILINVFILPVVLYLLYSIFRKGESEISSQKDSGVMMSVLIFVILFIVGVYRVYSSQKPKEIINNETPMILNLKE